MSEEIECVVPEGKSATNLTVAELSWCSKRLGTDVLSAVSDNRSPDRAMGFAYVATAWARRGDPKVEVARFSAMELPELMQALGMGRDDAETPADAVDQDDPETNPTDSALE